MGVASATDRDILLLEVGNIEARDKYGFDEDMIDRMGSLKRGDSVIRRPTQAKFDGESAVVGWWREGKQGGG